MADLDSKTVKQELEEVKHHVEKLEHEVKQNKETESPTIRPESVKKNARDTISENPESSSQQSLSIVLVFSVGILLLGLLFILIIVSEIVWWVPVLLIIIIILLSGRL